METNEIRALARELGPDGEAGYLTKPFPHDLDGRVEALVKAFENGSSLQRDEITALVGAEQSFGLLAYAERMAILAVREKSMTRADLAYSAIVLEGFRWDPRETLLVLALVFHSASKLGEDPGKHFESLLRGAPVKVADRLRQFAGRAAADRSIQAMGYVERTDASGQFTYHRTW